MPPKRKRAPWDKFLEEHEDKNITSADQITQSMLEQAYAGALGRLPEACKKERAIRAKRQREEHLNIQESEDGRVKSTLNVQSDSEVELIRSSKANKSATSGATACNAKNCEHRSACLNWSGGAEDWDNEAKAFKRFCTRLGLGPDPSTRERDPNVLVGLKNLGATCYANSFLQVWFQNRQFRSAVYRCIPSTSALKLEDLPLFQLQVTFTALQKGPTSVFNPQPLVRSLRLQETEQQDSSEFGKLFLGLLDSQFARQQDPSVKSVVSDLFAGQMFYGTRCHGCQKTSERGEAFYELEINLKPGCILEDRINSLFQEEELSGPNQYHCERCDGLRDATRFTRLGSLPQVLHFSLMRFVYDFDAEERKKTNNFITFPAQLDMSAYVAPSKSGEAHLYDLVGVLLHQGSSAHFGHYTADVYDMQHQKWFHCDDELVEAISSPFQNRKELSGQAKSQAKKNGKKAVHVDCTESEDDGAFEQQSVIRSKDAYMLVYARRDSSASIPEPEPPAQAYSQVMSLYEQASQETCVYKTKRDEAKQAFDKARSRKQQLYETWWPDSPDKAPSFFISAKGLKNFMTWELQPKEKAKSNTLSEPPTSSEQHEKNPNSPSTDSNGSPALKNDLTHAESEASGPRVSIDMSDILCPHGRLVPDQASNVKRVSESFIFRLQDLEVSMNPALQTDKALCPECVFNILAGKSASKTHERDIAEFKNLSSIANGTHFASQSRRYWISKAWLDDWRRVKPTSLGPDGQMPAPDAEGFKSDVHCDHGNLQPSVVRRKDINEQEYQFLCKRFPQWTTPDNQSRKCQLCSTESQKMTPEDIVQRAASEKANLPVFFSDLSRIHKLEPSSGTQSILIPKAFLKSWKVWVKKPLVNDRPDRLDMTPFRCDHDQVALDPNNEVQMNDFASVSPEEWSHFKDYHPSEGFIIQVSSQQKGKLAFEPPMCKTCQEKRLQDFEEATIQLLILNEDDFDDQNVKRTIAAWEPPKEQSKPAMKDVPLDFNNGSLTLRRSERARNVEQKKSTQRKVQAVTVKRSDRVLDLKLQIQHLFKTVTIYQRLWFRDEELDDNQATMKQIGIYEGAVVELFEVDTSDESKLAKLAQQNGRATKRQRRDQEGFSATGLHGFDTTESGSETPMEIDGPEDTEAGASCQEKATRACPQCTLENELDAQECDACKMPLAID